MKLSPQNQGKIVAEFNGSENCWYVMFPNSEVQVIKTRKAVESAAKRYFKKNVEPGKVGIGKIEWRT